jgi:hypothetical protein
MDWEKEKCIAEMTMIIINLSFKDERELIVNGS